MEKYEFVNGKDDNPYMKWKIKNVPNHQPEKLVSPPLGYVSWLSFTPSICEKQQKGPPAMPQVPLRRNDLGS